jgi:hypothetical protein
MPFIGIKAYPERFTDEDIVVLADLRVGPKSVLDALMAD